MCRLILCRLIQSEYSMNDEGHCQGQDEAANGLLSLNLCTASHITLFFGEMSQVLATMINGANLNFLRINGIC